MHSPNSHRIFRNLLFGGVLFVLFNHSATAFAGLPNQPAFLAQQDSLPVPSSVKNLLFYLQRSTDSNTVIYELNISETGQLIEEDPVSVYWIRYTDGGVRENLTVIQQKLAYGIMVNKLKPDHYELRLVSYPRHPLYLIRSGKGSYKVYTRIDGRMSVLHRIFIQVDCKGCWMPNVEYIELCGVEVKDNARITSRIINP